jgi:signal transduction histidine kinase/HAMP domain-containing protein/ActR/RegA family two-component response regulator
MRSGDLDASHPVPPGAPRPRGRSGRRAGDAGTDQRLRALRDALWAARQGDFAVRLPIDGGDEGLLGEVALAFNALCEQNEALGRELHRVARTVGAEGRLTDRASIGPVGGSWATAIDSLNRLIEGMAFPTLEASRILDRVAAGDLGSDMPVHAEGQSLRGELMRLGTAVNSVVGRLRTVSTRVSHVVREIGTDGRLGVRAELEGMEGTWRSLIDDVNLLSSNLTAQVRNIAVVSTAIANGDLSQKITVDTRGEILELKNTINTTVDQLRSFAAEVIRVAREVGTEGQLGAQADVRGVSGVWQELTDSVNRLASNLTSQVRNIAQIASAIAMGDLSQKITVEAKGEVLELKATLNATVDQLRSFASEVTRVAREVGAEGRLGAQADVKGVSGTWKDLTDTVNMLAGNLTDQVRNIALVATAIANGDLSQKITVEAKGEILELKNTVNAMVDRLQTFGAEVTRVAREVGTEGKLGGQADAKGVSGTWKDLTDNVNLMARNLTDQVRGIARVVTAVAGGDLSKKFVVEAKGEIAALADTINAMTDTLRTFADQVTTVASEVGIEGKLGGQAKVPGVSGTWRDLTDNVNMLAGNLTNQVRNIALVTTAVANGDLSQKITVEAKGEILELKDTINTMVDQLRTFAKEVTRVAREVGTEGKLGGQARVPEVAGTWQELTESVNVMASNLTSQVRGIAVVVTAVANGDLAQRLVLEARGEIASLADTINGMTDTLRIFADQVTTVAREVGIEGKLGGQAKVPGASGTWRDLVDNVNQLAGNLTTQVRAIAEVASAVTKGDLTRTIDVEALGEVLALKDTINQMIANLRDTTRTNKEQDWLKTNLAKFSGMMQGQRSLESLAQLIMSELTPAISAQVGTFFVMNGSEEEPMLRLLSSYGYTRRKRVANRFGLGEGLVGQSALEKKPILVSDVPDEYVTISSSLGEARPRNIVVLPILFEGQVRGVIELGSFEPFGAIHITFLEQLALSIGVVFNMINASRRTEELLEELKRSNAELGRRSKELEDKAYLLEVRNREIAEASANLEEKAKELALVSRYKSEFLANMSHELRTPLNSVIILANLLFENQEANLTNEQRDYAKTILSSGRDLLALINQILDLSKIEAGKMEIDRRRVPLGEVLAYAEQHFLPIAEQKRLRFASTIATDAPPTITTDAQRLQQILKNLLSNAVKFTETGSVDMRLFVEHDTRKLQSQTLRRAPAALAFSITDSGIGIAADKQQIIFEAFQQVDASTSRIYGGTGLGLTISRELARLLGGEIHLQSQPMLGSTFTLYLPIDDADYAPAPLSPSAPTPERGGYEVAHTVPAVPTVLAVKDSDPPATAPSSVLAGRKIVVVDDDVRNLFAVTSLLERRGAVVLPAAGARECFETLETHPDAALVLMDMMMPEIDGYEATRRIRRDDRWRGLPVVALTAKAMPGDREKVLEAGCDDFVAKPVEQGPFIATLERRIRKERP